MKSIEINVQTGEAKEVEVEPLAVVMPSDSYKASRQFAYPSIGDQLDSLFHAGVFPPEMAAKIQAVKDKYPKS